MAEDKQSSDYQKNSLSLGGAVSMGTGVMIGAGIFALTGQVAELAGEWFPYAFLAAAVVAAFSAYSYVKMSNAYPSAGGIAMILNRATLRHPAQLTPGDRIIYSSHTTPEVVYTVAAIHPWPGFAKRPRSYGLELVNEQGRVSVICSPLAEYEVVG